MANQVTVSQNNTVNVTVEPPANVQVQISRAVIGTVANVPTANFANFAGVANVANVALVANSVNVANVSGIGNIATINLNGNVQTVLKGDGTWGEAGGNTANFANYANFAGTAFSVAGGNVVGEVANAAYAGISASAYSVAGSNVSGPVANATYASTAGSADTVAGANVTGQVPYAAVANSVAGANVSGQVGYAQIANSVAGSNVSGFVANASHATIADSANSVSAANISGTVANANYASFAGTAFSVSGSNVVGYVSDANHANIADSANSVAGANVSGYVANATHATVADSANSVAGSNVSGQVANALVAGTVYTNAQPNITSIGTLTSLAVSGTANLSTTNVAGNLVATGNITAAYFLGNVIGNISGNLVVPGTNTSVLYNDSGNAGASSNFTFDEVTNLVTVNGNVQANFLIGDGSQITNLNGNAIGNVGFANFANFAGTAYSVSGANVSGAVAFATTANSVAGSNVSGTVANATYAITAGTAYSVSGSNVSGEVANAAYATIAGTAYSVSGANVSGDVSGANHANVADVANSVAGSNVSGAVAFATTANSVAGANVSGEVSYAAVANSVAGANVSGTVANATYANIAGTAYSVSGANISGEVANANYATFAGTAYSVSGSNVTSQVANANFSVYSDVANSANSVAVANVTGIGNIATTNYDGNVANILHGDGSWGPESGSLSANYANFAGEAFSVSGSNVSGEVANAAYATVAGSADSVAVANVSGIGNIATVNLDGSSSNVLYGNGIFAGLPAYDSNYANFAGTVVGATQSNITTVGNLLALNINNSVANTRSPTTQFIPTGTNVGNAGGALSSFVYTDYGSQSSNVNPMNWSFVKARGNSAVPTSAANNDQILRFTSHVYNGNTSPRAALIATIAPLAGNATFQQANVAWTPGTFNMVTGNPNGNIYSNTASSPQNAMQFDQYGRLFLVQGSNGSGSTFGMSMVGYGANSDGSGGALTILQQRARGSRDGNTAVGNNDSLGGLQFLAHTGAGFVTSGGITGVVNTSYGAITSGQRAPTDVSITSGSNTTSYTTTFQGDGNVQFQGNILTSQGVVASYLQGDGGNISNISAANITGSVANASYADIAGTAYSVAGSNVSGEVANAAYATIAGTANSVAVANVSGIGNIATINLDGSSSNVLYGNGAWAPVVTGDANYANYAGNVVNATQSNITTVGNLLSLNIDNTVANTRSPQFQYVPAGSNVGIAGANVSSFVYTDYGSQSSNANPMNWSFIKARGNSAAPSAASNNDQIVRLSSHVYSGNGNPRASVITTSAPSAANATFQTANVAWTPGQINIVTGNPNGNVTSNTASSPQNLFQLDQFGRLNIIQGSSGSGSIASVIVTNYGSNTDGSGGGGNIVVQRARGSRDGSTAVANNDGVGGLLFTPFNGNAFFTSGSGINGTVNTTYGSIANGSRVPVDIRITSTSNTTSFATTFTGDGNIILPSSTSSINYPNGSPYASSLGNTITSGQITLNPTSAGNPQLTINGNSASANSGTLTLNDAGLSVNINGDTYPGGAPSFSFSTYQTANSGSIAPQFYKRYSGTIASPSGVDTGDQILNQYYQVYGDSGNTNMTLGGIIASVGNVFSPGNISFNYQVYSGGNASDKFIVNFPTIELNGTANIDNLQLQQFQETEYSIGSVSGTITPDFVNGSIQTMTLNGNITMNSLANVAGGKSMTLVLTQDGTGGRTLTSTMKFAGGNQTLSTTPGAVDIISVFYTGSTYYATLSKGYA